MGYASNAAIKGGFASGFPRPGKSLAYPREGPPRILLVMWVQGFSRARRRA